VTGLDGELTYRRAKESDVEVLADLRVRFLNEVRKRERDPDAAKFRRNLRDYFARALAAGDFIGWFAEIDGRIVATGGMVLWRIPPRSARPNSGRLGYVLNFFTFPEARKRGICQELMARIIEDGRAAGVASLELHATPDGIGIYRRMGFAEPHFPAMERPLDEPESW
jgi:GNAT superfamily N-acetyltransferase